MKNIGVYLILLLSSQSFAQINLVPNPSFEDTVSCPTGPYQIIKAIGWNSYRGTPDYFNSCNLNQVGVPSNFAGYRYAQNGNSYTGFYGFVISSPNDRECIGAQLLQPLVIGQKYFVAFYVSRGINDLLSINVAINKIGIKFSTIPYAFTQPVPIDNFAHVYSDSIISDSVNWVKISGSFVANMAYNYLAVGNFFTDSFTSHISFNSSAAFAYYYVDDIRISTDSNFVNGMNATNSLEKISIYPNPAHDWISIEGTQIIKISLYDILGKLCFSKEVSYCSLEGINISHFSKGIYFLRVQSMKENIIKKLIIN